MGSGRALGGGICRRFQTARAVPIVISAYAPHHASRPGMAEGDVIQNGFDAENKENPQPRDRDGATPTSPTWKGVANPKYIGPTTMLSAPLYCKSRELYFSAGKPSVHGKEKLMMSQSINPFQSGTNKYDSQKSMAPFGAFRDVKDKIKCNVLNELNEDMQHECNNILRLQTGTNKFASQAGQSMFGSLRDVLPHVKCSILPEVPEEKMLLSNGIIRLQSGTNKLASQKHMSMGAQRGVMPWGGQDLLIPDAASQGFIHLQMGTNRFDSQAGMTGFGSPRTQITKYKDEQRGELPFDESSVSQQTVGSLQSVNQNGMTGFGAIRANIPPGDLSRPDRVSQGIVMYQMGVNWLESQAGKTAFGAFRDVGHKEAIDDTHPTLPDHIEADPWLPRWTIGSMGQETQEGMTSFGMPRDPKGHHITRLW